MRSLKLLLVLLACSAAMPVVAGPHEDVEAKYSKGDYATALRLLHPLADQGDAWGQYILGFMHNEGKGVARDYAEGMSWFRKAAAQGHPNAQYRLGFMYANGQGVAQDYAKAATWYLRAAQQGDASAQNSLGFMYANGQGVAQDTEQAFKWYNIVYARSYVRGTLNQGDLDIVMKNRDAVAATMSPTQITDARKMASEWAPKSEQMAVIDGNIKCISRRDWWITVVSGPCDGFVPPAHLAVGERFEADGKTRTVGVIVAREATRDLKGSGLDIRKGEWTCVLGETRRDINTGGDHDARWLYVSKCKPVPLD